MREALYQITLPYACCGIVTRNGMVTQTAPLLAWAVGQSFNRLGRWVCQKHGVIVLVEEKP